MSIIDFIKKIFGCDCNKPLWSHGLECEICKMTFVSENAHISHVEKMGTLAQHTGKIPVLRR